MVCYLSFRLSVHLSVRPCFCLRACSPVVGRAACFLRLRPSASPPSSPSIKPSEFSLRGLLLELPFVRPPLCPSVFLSVRLFACRRPGRLFPSSAYVVCYLSFRLSVHLSVRPCFCLCACSPVVGRAACFLRLRPSASPPSSPFIKPSEFSLRGLNECK